MLIVLLRWTGHLHVACGVAGAFLAALKVSPLLFAAGIAVSCLILGGFGSLPYYFMAAVLEKKF